METELMENGNFRLFAAYKKQKWQTSVYIFIYTHRYIYIPGELGTKQSCPNISPPLYVSGWV